MIGFAGTDAKVAYLKELGFDVAINYKKITNLDETIQKAAPKGVDVYFDNVSIVVLLGSNTAHCITLQILYNTYKM